MPEITTLKEALAWSYASLARAHTALEDGAQSYTQKHHIIRSRLYSGLMKGTMNMRSMYDDEKAKIALSHLCAYCGSTESLSVDHLLPRLKGGMDTADNLITACRHCNSSKRDRDVLDWHLSKGKFPTILVLRRYLKLVSHISNELGLLETKLDQIQADDVPFAITMFPVNFPPLSEIRLHP